MIDSFQINDLNKFRFSLSEEKIIENFTGNKNNEFLNDSSIPHILKETKNNIPNNLNDEYISFQDNLKDKYNDHGENDNRIKNYSIEILLHKIRNLENEKQYLLKFLEDKKNKELEYLKALETQAALVNSENKKSEYYENEWLNMKSLEYSLVNSGKASLRQTLELFYEEPNLYEKLGSLTKIQEIFITNLIEDHKNLIKERSTISKKYHEAVDANFQLYQQNEMLKAQNMNILEKNKDIIDEETENKLKALNSSLIYVQKENIELKEILDQYTKLITNIKKCSEISDIMKELDKFKNYLLI
ncbi:conserved Plasmodium protein, unknown function [Plasmodium gallinaceum]|uniref:Uncharacterized protein n=1 Tax=Plasmodium gallinaceum TaxID=5849 RepID=A0A1J1GPY3_PLAGA|nr:conserved Plasmodium protein, unknown function [Plasmodium gallinaceum]CRG94350.1 conserved Plasmodium protein, unknown function [Plasmodium gallinaceum]